MENRTYFLSIHLKRSDFQAQQLSLQPIVETATGFPTDKRDFVSFAHFQFEKLSSYAVAVWIVLIWKIQQVKQIEPRKKSSI